jgi:uncharacterized protein
MNYTEEFIKAGKFAPEETFIKDNILLETILGSRAYGCDTETSDFDIVGIFMDRHQDLYPQNYNMILGFDNLGRFESKEIKGEGKRIILPNGKECEAEWHSLTNFFFLTGIKGSPPLVECLFTRRNFVTQATELGWMLRDNRRLFLSARTFQAFKGYSFGQLHRIRKGFLSGKSDNPKRQDLMDRFKFDCKMSYHLLRLIDEIEQILTTNDIDLMRNREECIAMREGRWGTFERLESHFNTKIEALEGLLLKGALPMQPRTGELHQLLFNCIEQFYGSMDKFKGTEYVSDKEIKNDLGDMKKDIDSIKSCIFSLQKATLNLQIEKRKSSPVIFDDEIKNVMLHAREEVIRVRKTDYVGVEHLFISMVDEGHDRIEKLLYGTSADLDWIRAEVERSFPSEPGTWSMGQMLPFTPRAKKIVEMTMAEAISTKVAKIEHMFLAFLRDEGSIVYEILTKAGLQYDEIRNKFLEGE